MLEFSYCQEIICYVVSVWGEICCINFISFCFLRTWRILTEFQEVLPIARDKIQEKAGNEAQVTRLGVESWGLRLSSQVPG